MIGFPLDGSNKVQHVASTEYRPRFIRRQETGLLLLVKNTTYDV